MKINFGKLLGAAVKAVKNNPEVALMIVGAIAPKAAGKVGQVIAAAKAAGVLKGGAV